MLLKFTTNRDTNGNRYTLIIDTEKKTFKADYNISTCYEDFVTISKADRKRMINDLEKNGFSEVIKL